MLKSVARAFVGEGDLTERQGAILVAAAGVVFSFTAIAYRAVDSATDWQFLTYRGASTAAAMLLLVALRRQRRPVPFHQTNRSVLVGAVLLAAVSMLYILALSRTTAAITLFMLAAAPIFAAIVGWLVLRERVERATSIAIGITAIGIALMVGTGLDAGSGVGVLLAALIPVMVGSYNVAIRHAGDVDPVIPALIASVLLTVAAGSAALVAGDGLAVSGRDLVLASVTGGFALGIGLPMFNLGHRSVSAARVSLLLMTEIVLAPLWVWIWPGERPRPTTIIGGAVVLGTVAWLVTRTRSGAAAATETTATAPPI